MSRDPLGNVPEVLESLARDEARRRKFTPARVVRVAEGLRDRCRTEMARCAEDPETWGDPGDARIDIDGNGWNVCTVLNLLRALGIEGCD